MMKTLVIYHSKNGTTKKMAQEIGDYLQSNGDEVKIGNIYDFSPSDIENADKLYLGCWTSGLFLFGQKPNKEWLQFSRQIPVGLRKKTTLFTTYKITTGSMFKEMRKALRYRGLSVENNALKSKSGNLTETQKEIILQAMN